MNGSGVAQVAALYEIWSESYHRIKRQLRDTETLTDFIDAAIERELQERDDLRARGDLPPLQHWSDPDEDGGGA
jgi:hypothetical protein